MYKHKKTLVIAPGRKTRGGITAVVQAYSTSSVWKDWNCIWIETYIDKNIFLKLLYFLRGYCYFIFYLPNCKLIHIHLSEPMSAFRKSFFFWPAKWLKKKIIIHFHSFSAKTTINGIYSNKYKALFNASDLVIVLSKSWENEVHNAFGFHISTKILYNPCPIITKNDYNNQLDKYKKKDYYILFAGTITERKGYLDLIKSFASVSVVHPEWKLVFAGNGDVESGLNLAAKLNIADKVFFEGWVSGKFKDLLFRNASIFCLPSYAEGFPMAVLDGLAYALPILTTPVGGISDVFTDGDNALIFKPGDTDTLSKCINKLIENKSLRNSLSEKSINLSNNTFSLKTITKQLDDIYKYLNNNI